MPDPVDEALPFERRMAATEARADAFFLRALGLEGLGRDDEARRALAKALQLDPDQMEARAFERANGGPGRPPSGPVRRKATPSGEATPGGRR
jgi:hypothetical protein